MSISKLDYLGLLVGQGLSVRAEQWGDGFEVTVSRLDSHSHYQADTLVGALGKAWSEERNRDPREDGLQ